MPKDETKCGCCGSGCSQSGCCSQRPMWLGMAKMLVLVVLVLGGMYIIIGKVPNPNIYMSGTPPEHAIDVSATAYQKVSPDLLVMQLSVKTEAANAKKAQQDNAVVSADLRSKLKALGLSEEDMQTTSYSVDPVYKSSYVCDNSIVPGKTVGIEENCHYVSVQTGYQAVQVLMLNVKALDKGGDIIDAASTAGVNQTFVDYVAFTLQDETRAALEKALLKNASMEAKSKAQNIASGLGVSLGKVLSASQSYSYYPYYRNSGYDAVMAAPGASTELSQGQVEVSMTVTTSFEVQ